MKRFGTFSGVFTPSFEAILGAVLFLILPMLTGIMGLWRMALIVILANTVTLATAFSIADCTTNLVNVGGGGMYAISRASLGKAFGGSIGIQLFLAQSASIGFYAIGFTEPIQGVVADIPFVRGLIGHLPVLVQKQILATILAFIAFIVGIIGANFVTKVQMIIFVILVISVGAIVLSPLIGSGLQDVSIFNSRPNFSGNLAVLGFWAAFAAFFPAVTGIDAGVGMSGNLKNPRHSLPLGTFVAIFVTFAVYLIVMGIFSFLSPEKLYGFGDGGHLTAVPAVEIFKQIPVISILLLVGILVATCSSALAYFLTAPSTAQALAQEGVLPSFLSFLGRDFFRGGKEPRWATVMTFLIVLPVIWSGDVTNASIVVGICFLVVYGWVNLAAFFERISGNPSFRPTSKGHWAISLYGFAVCMIVISLFNVWVGLGVVASQLIIFMLLLKYKTQNRLEGVWWGVLFSVITWGFKRMRRIIQGTKNWRPIVGIFCMADTPDAARRTLEMGGRISDFQGLTMINILKPKRIEEMEFEVPDGSQVIEPAGDDFDNAITSILQSAMPGGFHMNTALLPLDPRLNHIETIEMIIRINRNVLLYSHGTPRETGDRRIDVWWKGEENGSLMALLAYIISTSAMKTGQPIKSIRIIRKLLKGEERKEASGQLRSLVERARLKGEILVLPEDDQPFNEIIKKHSFDAYLILMGLPGKRSGGIARLFSLDRYFFTKEIDKFKDLPPVLFVKAHAPINLFY